MRSLLCWNSFFSRVCLMPAFFLRAIVNLQRFFWYSKCITVTKVGQKIDKQNDTKEVLWSIYQMGSNAELPLKDMQADQFLLVCAGSTMVTFLVKSTHYYFQNTHVQLGQPTYTHKKPRQGINITDNSFQYGSFVGKQYTCNKLFSFLLIKFRYDIILRVKTRAIRHRFPYQL